MRITSLLSAAVFTIGLFMAGFAMAQAVEQPRGVGLDAQIGGQQIQALNDIKNFSLLDQQGQTLGQIDQVLVDMERGLIGYVVVQSALGQTHVIPYNALQIDPQRETLTLQMEGARFSSFAPTGDALIVRDQNIAEEIHEFYGVSPYWEDDKTGVQPGTMRPPAIDTRPRELPQR
jgi:hypothetical protein